MRSIYTQNVIYDKSGQEVNTTRKQKGLITVAQEKYQSDGVFGLDLNRNSQNNPFFNFNNTVIMM